MAADTNVAVAFGGGMLSFLSPCVLPLVPGYLSLMSGVSVSEQQGGIALRTQRAQVLRSTLLFVAGFTVVFVALGLTASAVGQALSDHRVVLDRAAGAAVMVMGLFLAGFVSSPRLMAERRFHVSPSGLGVFAPPVMGMAFAFGWTPCIGPILSAVLAVAGEGGSPAKGMALLAAYSLGLGVPFVASGLALHRLTGVFGWVKRHYRVINVVSGLLLVGFGLLLFFDRLGTVSQHLVDLLDRLHLDRLANI
jgi:cytochrome c-type biogenesis protein